MCVANPSVCVVVVVAVVVAVIISSLPLRSILNLSFCASSNELVSVTEVSFSLLSVALLCSVLFLGAAFVLGCHGEGCTQTCLTWSYGYTCALILPLNVNYFR